MTGSEKDRADTGAAHRSSSWPFWHLAAVLVVALAPTQIYLRRPVWVAPPDQRTSILALALAYAVAVLLLTRAAGSSRRPKMGGALTALLTTYGIAFFFMLALPGHYSRGTLGVSLVIGALLMVLSTRLRSGSGTRLSVLALASAVCGLLVLGFSTQDRFEPLNVRHQLANALALPDGERRDIASHLYTLDVRTFRNHFDVDIDMQGGALAPLGESLLVSNARGHLFVVEGPDFRDEAFQARKLETSVPLGREAYLEDFGRNLEQSFFRVTDVLVDEDSKTRSGVDVYAVHSAWQVEQQCVRMQVSRAHWDSVEAILSDSPATWETVYATKPCRRLESENQGGRLVLTSDRRLILSLGDFDHDGVVHPERFAQDPDVDYGKILELDPENGSARILSLGHRNPQGLFADDDGTIWATEHGPRGGDELNRIVEGRNYGWPLATYGTAYYSTTWPLSEEPGSHAGYEGPVFSWVPSVAITSLIRVDSARFPLWRGDFLIASLKDRSLFRVRMRGEAAAYVERIEIGERIRDLETDGAGRLILWAEDGTLIVIDARAEEALERASAAAGEALFATCLGCHAGTAAVAGAAIAPSLEGVFGRPIAADPSFEYSRALAAVEGVWDEANLDAFLADPRAFASERGAVGGSGGSMPAVSDPIARASLIEYLKEFR